MQKKRPLSVLVFCFLVVLVVIPGCSREHYKADADDEVYTIMDAKWGDGLGSKVNYRISDVSAGPNDLSPVYALDDSGVLSLADAVAVATANNRDYQSRKEQLYLRVLDLTLERHSFARQWFGTIDAGYTRDGDDEQLEIDGQDTKLGFSQLLADGASIGASIAIDWARFLTGDPRTSLGSVLSASITAPLLRGSGRRIAQENLTQAERDALYEIRSFNRFRKTFVVSIVSDYYRVLQQRDTVTNAENDYQRAIESKERLEMEANAGRKKPFEVDQAQQRVLQAGDSLVRAQERYEQSLDEFKLRLVLPAEAEIELDQDELKALADTGVTQPDYTLDDAVETALARRLDLATSRDNVDDAARKVEVAADGLGAELNLSAGMGVGSTPQTDFTRLQFHNGTYTLGLSADLPLDRKSERNAYRRSLITYEQQRRAYENDEDNVKLGVRDAYRELNKAAQTYQIQVNSLELAQKRVESSSLLLEAGRLTTRDLLDSQDDLLRAQNELTAALVGHIIAKLNFFRDIGVLQVRPDGMWEQGT
ncbi:MAG TPA: TolC family protein [Planctomycetes bacterium]|nr:TolC family protein [Planctomycetota bacterium]HIJ71612.1 TolC family protein [Planctomycetota bacterium]